ncbi:MAG: AAA family ATPase [Candidatus Lokiarchaeota archaeon]|nr:AAA family ATPase [Candidatus Lokiarchaeota archaeon]
MQILIVSGTPGTGKTTISNNIQNYIEAKVISLNELAISENLIEKYDTKRETSIIDNKKLIGFLIKLIEEYKKGDPEFLIIESHFSDIVPEQYIDFVIILRCDPDELYNRLKRRGYKTEKIRENVQSEILGNCVNYFMKKPINTPILEIDTTMASIEFITKTIINILTKSVDIKDFYAGKVDWLEKLFQEDRLQVFFD